MGGVVIVVIVFYEGRHLVSRLFVTAGITTGVS